MYISPHDSKKRVTVGKRIFQTLLLFELLTLPQLLLGQSTPPVQDENFDKSSYYNLIEEIKKVDYATQCARNAATAFADSSWLPEVLFQLSEWEFLREKLHFDLAMMKYNLQMQLFENGKLKNEPTEPHLTYEKALEINNRLLTQYPEIPFIGGVLYRMGICLFEIGKKDSSKKIFQKLVTDYPDSSYLDEVLFRLGECYFNEGEYETAIRTYQQILASYNSPFFPMALYKIAWCHYRLNNYAEAISTFYYLLNDIKTMQSINSELSGKTQIQLQDEITEYITLSFSDFGGASRLYTFIKATGGSEYAPVLLHKLGEVYLKRDFHEDALSSYNLLLNNYKNYQNLPQIFPALFQCYEALGFKDKAYATHDLLLEYCGPKSEWARRYHSRQDSILFKNILTEIDFKIATPLLYTADSLLATKNYKEGSEKYTLFLRLFETDDRADHACYNLAECYYNLSNYEAAANSYKNMVLKYPKSELCEDAAYNQIVCYDQLIDKSSLSIDDSSRSVKNNKNIKNLVLACDSFLKLFPTSNKEPEIKLKLAEISYHKKLYATAEKYAKSALASINKYNRGKEYKTNAINLLAQINFKQEKFKDTERLTKLLIKENPDSTELVERSEKMLASISFKIGEQLKSEGKTREAARKFEEAALTVSDPQVAEASLFEAAVQFENDRQFNRAIINFEQFYKKYPKSEHNKEAIYRAALLREKLQQYQLAARDYILLHELIPGTPEGKAALFNAGLAYEKVKDWLSMAETFKKYITNYPQENETILEAIFKIAFAYEQKKMIQQANLEYQKLVDKYNQLKAAGESADDYYAAQASFRLAEIKHDQFRVIKLNPPFQVNLTRKQTVFNDLLKLYVDVAKFNIAEWTTAAFYKLGLSYEEFCQDILDSPAPPNLKGADLKSYWASINQQWVIPLQKEALKYYQTNEKLATENNVNNDWIKKTRARVLFLNEKLAMNNTSVSSNEPVKEASSTVKPPEKQPTQKL